jgi:hypothetical protein
MHRTRSGRRIELTERDLALFEILMRYRYLRSTYLHAFVGGASETRFKERLGDLFHEGYLDRSQQQWEFADARCRPAVYEIGKKGRAAFHACGRTVPEYVAATTAQKQFLHAVMICEALGSLELAVRTREGLRFISWPEILARAPEDAQCSARPLSLPVASGRVIVPDAVFGLEYRANDARRYRFFALEADRGTMPIARTRPGQTSYLAKLAAYHEVLSQQGHKSRWGIPNLLVLTLTTSEARRSEILNRLGEGSAAFLFKASDPRTLQAPLPDLLSEPWVRGGHAPLSIAESS